VPTLRSLSRKIALLQRRVEMLEDLMDLRLAVAENRGQPTISWVTVKKQLGVRGRSLDT
jgi:hypothetical protein